MGVLFLGFCKSKKVGVLAGFLLQSKTKIMTKQAENKF